MGIWKFGFEIFSEPRSSSLTELVFRCPVWLEFKFEHTRDKIQRRVYFRGTLLWYTGTLSKNVKYVFKPVVQYTNSVYKNNICHDIIMLDNIRKRKKTDYAIRAGYRHAVTSTSIFLFIVWGRLYFLSYKLRLKINVYVGYKNGHNFKFTGMYLNRTF